MDYYSLIISAHLQSSDKDCFDLPIEPGVAIYIYVYMYLYIYIHIYARSGTVQLNHSLMDRPVNL